MSCVIRTLIENANDLILVLDDFNENMSVKDLKVWLPAFADFLDGFDENISIKQFKVYLDKILS